MSPAEVDVVRRRIDRLSRLSQRLLHEGHVDDALACLDSALADRARVTAAIEAWAR